MVEKLKEITDTPPCFFQNFVEGGGVSVALPPDPLFFVYFVLIIEATLVKDWNPKDKNPEKYFKDGSFHTELGFVVFPIKTAESHAKIPDGPPLDWYKIRHVPSWFKLGPSIKLQVCIQEDELWTPEMLENKQVNTKIKQLLCS